MLQPVSLLRAPAGWRHWGLHGSAMRPCYDPLLPTWLSPVLTMSTRPPLRRASCAFVDNWRTRNMHDAMEPTQDPLWVLNHDGYSVLTESAVESRFAIGNGFLGARGSRSVSRGPTWVSLLGYVKWASWPRCYVAGLFDQPNT